MDDYSYIGSGRGYLREIGATAGAIEIGNCSNIDFAVTEDEKKLQNYMSPGGGTRNSVKRVSAVTMNVTFHDVNADNLERFGYGKKSTVASGSVTGESHVAYKGAFVAFDFLSDATTPTVTSNSSAPARANTTAYALGAYVTPATANGFYYKATTAGTSGGTVPTYPTTIGGTVVDGTVTWTCMGKTALVENTDFEVRSGGVLILSAASITDGETLTFAYTKATADRVDLLVASGKLYELIFVGANEARGGKKMKYTAFRVKPGFLSGLSLVGEEYAAPTVAIELLEDPTKVGEGISKYVKIEIEA